MKRGVAAVWIMLIGSGGGLTAQAPEGSAAVFQRYAGRIAKVQVVETGSGAKASLGSAFFVSADGLLLTNYHVIAEAVDADRYRVEWLSDREPARPAEVLAVDVIRDLAVLATGTSAPGHFSLTVPQVLKGTRLYSLGHPADLGLSITEGVYNGHLEHSIYPRIHFTGPLNPGMSGGPSLTGDGVVVGVNVSTAGQSLSFLVPIEVAVPLIERARRAEAEGPGDFTADIGRQLLENQAAYLGALFDQADSSVVIGPFELPTQPADFFRCWADADRGEELLYEMVDHQCSTDDDIFISGSQSSGIFSLTHRVLVSRGLSPLRFYSLYTAQFRAAPTATDFLEEDEVTDSRCRDRNVRRNGMLIRTRFCLRRYTRFEGLYDAVLVAAVLGARDAGVVTTLSLSGVSYENAERLARHYLERIRWARR
ncbi:MAG: serine protease [Gemmatimonadales bacterium]